MRNGTNAASSGQVLLAERLYLEALVISRALLEGSHVSAEPPDDRVAAFVVTHLNLADLHAEAENPALAADYLCTAHCALMSLLRDPGADRSLQQAALRHSRETHAALLEHLGQHGNVENVLAALRAGCMSVTANPARPAPTLH
ncbi:hypothetical protein [Variovorax sp. Sphag1AA]|uniref:hypothetical protein n=1 Tax=Variovorax sp. Sphag1AA TaxID=2587027 RepID=UPI0016082CA8|nr:hypothetical protein [Variovorax sp. Sphag1AA]MBB3181234.1 hypothetical protein [Variovorax sp. Sphag1AA]